MKWGISWSGTSCPSSGISGRKVEVDRVMADSVVWGSFWVEDDIETVPDTDDVDEEMLVDIGSPSGVLVDISVLSIMLSAKEGGFVSGFSSEMLSVGFSSS